MHTFPIAQVLRLPANLHIARRRFDFTFVCPTEIMSFSSKV